MNVITLTTDFGTRDSFVGTMKGVILSIHPKARMVDLTHEVPPGDIRAGAFALAAAYRYFPRGTVHLAVVDPGVGGSRNAIAVQTARYTFVAPDNGLLSLALASERVRSIRVLKNESLLPGPMSRTFHGRDLFAPIAAHLSRGTPFQRLGPRTTQLTHMEWPAPAVSTSRIRGEILYVDYFGNAISNIPERLLPPATRIQIRRGTRALCELNDCYASVPTGRPVAVVGSSGYVELAVRDGSAAHLMKLKRGDKVSLVFLGPASR